MTATSRASLVQRESLNSSCCSDDPALMPESSSKALHNFRHTGKAAKKYASVLSVTPRPLFWAGVINRTLPIEWNIIQHPVLDDVTGQPVFLGISRFPLPCIPALLHTHIIHPTSALKTIAQTLTAWNTVFYIAAGVKIVPFFIYLFFGSVDEQPWNRTHQEEADHTGKPLTMMSARCLMPEAARWEYGLVVTVCRQCQKYTIPLTARYKMYSGATYRKSKGRDRAVKR
ncbi:hypothetical protein PR048_018209 [Dryococelus australis]|uniref:Uncharacterized protein n=1 Tax=Dryococelus australis TaxID=614101 RepID=A0ABQ9HCB5_9NEOP|nr:hypothetical protein PR048_018209 [Dryococelus australis]